MIRLILWSAPTCRSFGFSSDSQFSSDIHSIRSLATRRSRHPGVISSSASRSYPSGGANDIAPAHATGVIRPSETAFVLALAISLAAYPTGEIQSSDKSEHSKEASPGSGLERLRRGQTLCSVLRVTAGAGGLFGEVRSGGLNH